MAIATSIDAPPICSARVGYRAGEWSEMPVFCSTSVGLTRYTDKYGIERRYCRHHKGLVEYRYPPKPAAEACRFCGDTAAIVDGRYVLIAFEDALSVVCDSCVEKADESEDDE